MTFSTSDPVVFVVLVIMIGITLTGLFFFAREIVASGVELAEQRKEQRRERERREGKSR